MNNKKCSSCGFINFVSAELCRKCDAVLPELANNQQGSYQRPYAAGPYQPYSAPRSFPVLKLAALVVVAAVVLSSLAIGLTLLSRRSRVKWREYRPESLDFTVMMPNEPTRREPTTTPLAVGSMTNHSYTSVVTGQGTVVFVFVDYLGIPPSDDNETLNRALDAELNNFIKRTDSVPLSKTPTSYAGMVGLDFELQSPGKQQSRNYGRMFMTKSRLYFLYISAKEGSELLIEKDRFLKSLEL